jgi:hypothetical protein
MGSGSDDGAGATGAGGAAGCGAALDAALEAGPSPAGSAGSNPAQRSCASPGRSGRPFRRNRSLALRDRLEVDEGNALPKRGESVRVVLNDEGTIDRIWLAYRD